MAIQPKKANEIKIFFRYSRVQKTFQDLLSKVLIDNFLIESENNIMEISKQGGSIDKSKFKNIISFVPLSI